MGSIPTVGTIIEKVNHVYYHITQTWNFQKSLVQPHFGRYDEENEDRRKRICVSPTIAQCIIGIGHWWDYKTMRLYSSNSPNAFPVEWVFDYKLTKEHRYYEPTWFQYLGEIDLNQLETASIKKIDPYDDHEFEVTKRNLQRLKEIDFALAM